MQAVQTLWFDMHLGVRSGPDQAHSCKVPHLAGIQVLSVRGHAMILPY